MVTQNFYNAHPVTTDLLSTYVVDRNSPQLDWLERAPAQLALGGFNELIRPVQEKVLAIEERGKELGLSVRFAFSGVSPSDTVVCAGHEGRNWAFSAMATDQFWEHPAGYPIPQVVVEELRRIQAANLLLGQICVAHEFYSKDVQSLAAPTLEMLTPPPSPQVQAKAVGLGSWASGFLRMAAAPLAGLGVGLAAASIAALPLAGLALDPILFAQVGEEYRTRTAGRVAFMYLTHWTYE